MSRLQIISLASLWIATLPNLAALRQFWDAESAGAGVGRILFALGGWVAIFFVTFTLLVIIGVLFWGRAIKWLAGFAIISAAILGYFSLYLGIQFDKTMVTNIMQTHTSEAFELMTFPMFFWVLLLGIAPAAFLITLRMHPRVRWVQALAKTAGVWLLLAAVVAASILLQYSKYAAAGRNKAITFHTIAPANFVAATVGQAYALRASAVVREKRGTDAQQSYKLPKPRLIVFVVGETARAQNFGLNGYARDNTPRMRDAGVLYFKDTESCGTATAVSLPCMFSGLTRDEFSLSKAQSIETVIDVALHAGVRVIWRDNDGGCKGVCGSSEYRDITKSSDPRFCSSEGECIDDILLDGLKDDLSALTGDTLLILHVKGSHGPAYYKRYPPAFEKFTPACKTNNLPSCTQEQLINAYDNTILYTDHILGEVVELLKGFSDRYATAMLYASDHGESLGENGLYLHGLPYSVAPKEQTRVPMLAWLSPQYGQFEKWNSACLAAQTKIQRSHDNIYSTILGLLEIETTEYKSSLDIFAACDEHREGETVKK